jgi:hypothetical protein
MDDASSATPDNQVTDQPKRQRNRFAGLADSDFAATSKFDPIPVTPKSSANLLFPGIKLPEGAKPETSVVSYHAECVFVLPEELDGDDLLHYSVRRFNPGGWESLLTQEGEDVTPIFIGQSSAGYIYSLDITLSPISLGLLTIPASLWWKGQDVLVELTFTDKDNSDPGYAGAAIVAVIEVV